METEIHLLTKLSRPRAVRYHLPRPHLTAVLQEGLTRRLTTLVATAGHGKTSTLAHFLSQVDLPALWIQLDPRDSGLPTFLRCLAIGISQVLGGGSRLLGALDADAPHTDYQSLILADLHETTGHVAIILDDFHLIERESPVVALIGGLLQYMEEKTHLFISSRLPLPFSTARLKVIQEAAEITEEDLRFTPAETRTFFQSMAGIELAGDKLEQVCHLTEGWSAALVLLTSAVKRRGNLDSLLNGTLPTDLFTYLADEVFLSLNPALQRFMEESSILDTCTPVACDGVLGRQDSAAMLGHLLSSNLLITQLGPDSLRYHHLLQRFLHERLKARESGDFARLHRQAGDWLLRREEPEEAVKHYLRGGWLQEAAELVESLAPVWLRTHRVERLRGLLSHLPQATKEQYPWISICEARHLLNQGKADHAVGVAHLALRSFEERVDKRGILHAHILLGEAFAVRHEMAAAQEEYRLGVAALEPEYRHEEGLLLQRRAALGSVLGAPTDEVEADLRRALSLFVELGDLPGEASVSDLLGIIRAEAGDYTSAVSYLERSAKLFTSMGEPPAEVGTNLAWIYNEVGRYNDAVPICERMLNGSSRKLRRTYAGLHLLHSYTRLGDFAKAAGIVPVANTLIEELSNRSLKTSLTTELSAFYRLSGQSQASLPFVNEAIQLAKQVDRVDRHVKPMMEAVLLHLFHTGNAGAAMRLAERTLERMVMGTHALERMILTLALAIAHFRISRTESRPEAARLLQEGLTECRRRRYEFFVLREWPLALTAVIYGLAYDVQSEFCLELLRVMETQLPTPVLQVGIIIPEADARLLPAAWQALPDDGSRSTFATLLSPQDRKRVVGLSTGPAPVRIQVLGPLVVTVAGEAVDVKALKKRKSGQLLTLLIAEEGPVPRERIMDRLWPDLEPGAADTSLRVTLHHLRRLLEPYLGGKSKSRYIQTEGGLMWFSRQPEVQIDIDYFREGLANAEEARASGDAVRASLRYEAACKLYNGDLAADEPYALDDIRDAWRTRYTDALDWLGQYYWHEVQDISKALITYQRRLAVDVSNEPAHQALMRLYLESGQVGRARQQYLTCKEALATQLGVEPSRTTESIHQVAISMESETTPETPSRRAKKKG